MIVLEDLLYHSRQMRKLLVVIDMKDMVQFLALETLVTQKCSVKYITPSRLRMFLLGLKIYIMNYIYMTIILIISVFFSIYIVC